MLDSIKKLSAAGAEITLQTLCVNAEVLLEKYNAKNLLPEHGGRLKLTPSWASKWFSRNKFTLRTPTRGNYSRVFVSTIR